MNIKRDTLTNITRAVLSSKRLYAASGNGIVEVDTEALAEEIVKAVEAQASFEDDLGDPPEWMRRYARIFSAEKKEGGR